MTARLSVKNRLAVQQPVENQRAKTFNKNLHGIIGVLDYASPIAGLGGVVHKKASRYLPVDSYRIFHRVCKPVVTQPCDANVGESTYDILYLT